MIFVHLFTDSSGEEALPQGVCTTCFPDSSGEEALPKEVWMLIFAHFFIDSSGEEALPKELGCAKRDRFLHNLFSRF